MIEKAVDLFMSGLLGMIFTALLGLAVFGVIAGYQGYTDYRIRQNICNELLKGNDYINYGIVCRSANITLPAEK